MYELSKLESSALVAAALAPSGLGYAHDPQPRLATLRKTQHSDIMNGSQSHGRPLINLNRSCHRTKGNVDELVSRKLSQQKGTLNAENEKLGSRKRKVVSSDHENLGSPWPQRRKNDASGSLPPPRHLLNASARHSRRPHHIVPTDLQPACPSRSRRPKIGGDYNNEDDNSPKPHSNGSNDGGASHFGKRQKITNPSVPVTPSISINNNNKKKKKSTRHRASVARTSSLARSASAKNRTCAFPAASTLMEATEADRMLFRLKAEGRPWKEITAEWDRITGKTAAQSSLSVRYLKSKNKFSNIGDPDISRLLQFKTQIEEIWEANEKWGRIAAMILADGGSHYTAQTLRIWYRNLVEEQQTETSTSIGTNSITDAANDRGLAGVKSAKVIHHHVAGDHQQDDSDYNDEHDDNPRIGVGSAMNKSTTTMMELDSLDRELVGYHLGNGSHNSSASNIHMTLDTGSPPIKQSRPADSTSMLFDSTGTHPKGQRRGYGGKVLTTSDGCATGTINCLALSSDDGNDGDAFRTVGVIDDYDVDGVIILDAIDEELMGRW